MSGTQRCSRLWIISGMYLHSTISVIFIPFAPYVSRALSGCVMNAEISLKYLLVAKKQQKHTV